MRAVLVSCTGVDTDLWKLYSVVFACFAVKLWIHLNFGL